MTPKGRVIDELDGALLVELERTASCSGCTQSGSCRSLGSCPSVTIHAENRCGARLGDLVAVNCISATPLFHAVLIFGLPLLISLCIAWASTFVFGGELPAILAFCGALIGSFAIIRLTFEKHARLHTRYVVSQVLERNTQKGKGHD